MVVRRISIVGSGVEFVKNPDDDANTASPQQQGHGLVTSPALMSCHRNTPMSTRDECLLLMVLCNTVQVETAADGSIKYPIILNSVINEKILTHKILNWKP